MELDTEREDGELAALAEEQGIRLSFLSAYQHSPGAAAPHTVVVNYPGADLLHLDEALERLAGLM